MTHVLTGLCLRQQMLMAFDGGSTFDAYYSYKWVNIACRLTRNTYYAVDSTKAMGLLIKKAAA